jgi:hypothetical protein
MSRNIIFEQITPSGYSAPGTEIQTGNIPNTSQNVSPLEPTSFDDAV